MARMTRSTRTTELPRKPQGVLESALYCPNLEAAERFYREVVGLDLIARQPGRHVFLRCGEGVVLLFDPEATAAPPNPGALPVPPHGARGPGHLAFRIPEAEVDGWRERLRAAGVEIESEVRWPRGGHSLYVRDPAGNSVEFATGSLWGLAEVGAAGE